MQPQHHGANAHVKYDDGQDDLALEACGRIAAFSHENVFTEPARGLREPDRGAKYAGGSLMKIAALVCVRMECP